MRSARAALWFLGVQVACSTPYGAHGNAPSPTGLQGAPIAVGRPPATLEAIPAAPHGLGTPDEVPPPKLPFEGRERVRYDEFVGALRQVADELMDHPNVGAAYARLLSEQGLSSTELPLESFSRVRLVFEAARDGGLWDLRWSITDQMPWSDRIWAQWSSRAPELEGSIPTDDAGPSALAECDELSALFAFLVRDLGVVGKVALHWPYWNHVVAVWELPRAGGHKARIVVPTSQVFLSREASLGTRELPTQRVLFPYARHDLSSDAELAAPLARFLVGRAQRLGALSSEQLIARRSRLGGS